MNRRGFLGWSGLVGLGLLAHHKPDHPSRKPPPTTTTLPATTSTVAPTTTTVGPTTTGPAGDADVYHDSYGL